MQKIRTRPLPRARIAALTVAALLAGTAAVAQPPIAPVAPPVPETGRDARADDLVRRMTQDEKIALIRGAQEPAATDQGEAGYLSGVPRLGIPPLRFADGPPGILTRLPSAALPATMALAATFSRADAEQYGAAIGLEARRLGIGVALEPFINMLRDVGFSRGWNTLGEDPLLTGDLGAAQIRGIQGQGVMAQAKHFVGYDLLGYRTVVDQQALHEVYLAPFQSAIDAGVSSLMCAYNYVNGAFSCGNRDLLDTTLRGEMGFKGFVTSDWGGAHASTDIMAGLDMEMPGLMPAGSPWLTITRSYFDNGAAPVPPLTMTMSVLGRVFERAMPEEGSEPMSPARAATFRGQFPDDPHPTNMATALRTGAVDAGTIDRAAWRVVHQMNRFGFLDRPALEPTGARPDPRLAAILRRTAADSAVLLKNEGGILPLMPADLRDLALVGPGAGQVVALGINAEHSLGLLETQHGVADLLRARPGATVGFAVGDDMTGTPIPPALFTTDGRPGLARIVGGRPAGVDRAIDFTGARALPPGTVATWQGDLEIAADGTYGLYLQVLGAHAEISVDGKPLGHTSGMTGARHGDTVQPGQDNLLPTTDGLDNVRREIALTRGRHRIVVTTADDTSRAPVQLRLNWVTPEAKKAGFDRAVALAASARKAVVFVWVRQKPLFEIPGDQNALVEAIAAANPNTVVVLNTSYPVAMPWLDKVKGVLNMWWPGDAGGEATVDVLTGAVSPAGRLPFTWAKRLADYPATDPARAGVNATATPGEAVYAEGIDIGYRWFARQGRAPLYPFGYGLGYTRFRYSGVAARRAADGGVDVSFRLANTGAVASDEVAQVYLDAPAGPAPRGVRFPVLALAGYDRVHLGAGESRAVTIHVAPRSLQYWDEAATRWRDAPRRRMILVGGSSADLPLRAPLP